MVRARQVPVETESEVCGLMPVGSIRSGADAALAVSLRFTHR